MTTPTDARLRVAPPYIGWRPGSVDRLKSAPRVPQVASEIVKGLQDAYRSYLSSDRANVVRSFVSNSYEVISGSSK